MRVSSRLLVTAAAALSLAVGASAQGRRPFDVPPGRTAQQDGRPLTLPSTASPVAVLQQYLRDQGQDAVTVQSIVEVARSNSRNGVRQGRYEQRVGGVPVYGTYAKAAFNARGEMVSLIENFVPVRGTMAPARVSAQQAIDTAISNLYPDLGAVPPGFFRNAPTAKSVAVPESNGTLSAGYLIETWTDKTNDLNQTLIGGDGAILNVESRTNKDTYNIYRINPDTTPQTVTAGAGSGNAQSPSGWLFATDQTTTRISGNNASAYLDTNADNKADAGGTLVASGDFAAVSNLGAAPSTTTNREVAVQNLFYLNNLIHDELYTHGFDEAAGNFQKDNFGKGGAGNDPVNAEAQDGSGTDNANFSTPGDGSSPRMQMYLWTGRGIDQVVVGGQTFAAQDAAFGPVLSATGVTGALALANDGSATTADACQTMPAGSLSNKIAIVERGTCDFTVKVKNAQSAGAKAVIVYNNQGDSIMSMGGTAKISIPSVFVGQTDGTTLKTKIGQTATVRLASPGPLQRDGDIDSDVVFHEYCHGLTWRMIGGMSGPIAGAIGEGMSDVCALLMNGDDRVGEYAYSDPLGIRRYPYANYPLTYAQMNSGEVHDDGELYGAIGWYLITMPQFDGRKNVLFDYLVDGMNYTPATPTYEKMRDGILQAIAAAPDQPGDTCAVWAAFAHYGVGVNAKASVKATRVTITESFAVPASCKP